MVEKEVILNQLKEGLLTPIRIDYISLLVESGNQAEKQNLELKNQYKNLVVDIILNEEYRKTIIPCLDKPLLYWPLYSSMSTHNKISYSETEYGQQRVYAIRIPGYLANRVLIDYFSGKVSLKHCLRLTRIDLKLYVYEKGQERSRDIFEKELLKAFETKQREFFSENKISSEIESNYDAKIHKVKIGKRTSGNNVRFYSTEESTTIEFENKKEFAKKYNDAFFGKNYFEFNKLQ